MTTIPFTPSPQLLDYYLPIALKISAKANGKKYADRTGELLQKYTVEDPENFCGVGVEEALKIVLPIMREAFTGDKKGFVDWCNKYVMGLWISRERLLEMLKEMPKEMSIEKEMWREEQLW